MGKGDAGSTSCSSLGQTIELQASSTGLSSRLVQIGQHKLAVMSELLICGAGSSCGKNDGGAIFSMW